MGIVDALGADDRALEHLQVLVVGGNEDVHGRQLACRRAAQARGVTIRLMAAIGPARHHEQAEEVVEDEQELGAKARPDPKLPGHAEAIDLEGRTDPPGKIAQQQDGPAQRHEAARPGAIMRQRRRDGEKQADHEGQRGRSGAEPHGYVPLGPPRAPGAIPTRTWAAVPHGRGGGLRWTAPAPSWATAWRRLSVSRSRAAATRSAS